MQTAVGLDAINRIKSLDSRQLLGEYRQALPQSAPEIDANKLARELGATFVSHAWFEHNGAYRYAVAARTSEAYLGPVHGDTRTEAILRLALVLMGR